MAQAGIGDIFVAYTLWAVGPKAGRLRALHDWPGVRLTVGADSAAGLQRLAQTVRGSDHPLRVLLEIDPGNKRTGLAPDQVADVALAGMRLGLDVAGLFTYGGHGYGGPDAPAGAAADEVAALAAGAAALRAAGFEPAVLSAGSTPTALAAARPPVTEVRPGTYLLGDRQQVALGGSPAVDRYPE